MYKRHLIPLLALALSATAVSTSYAIPVDDTGTVLDIKHWVTSFWQLGDSNLPELKGWGCDKYAEKGTANPCKDDNGRFLYGTIGKHGCARSKNLMGILSQQEIRLSISVKGER